MESAIPATRPQENSEASPWAAQAESLREWFGSEFVFFNGANRTTLDSHYGNELLWAPLAAAAADRQQPEFVAETGPVLLLAIPLSVGATVTGVAPFLIAAWNEPDIPAIGEFLGRSSEETREWLRQQPIWNPNALLRVAGAWCRNNEQQARAERLEAEVESLSQSIAHTYEEISLLYGLTQKLRISSTDEELGRLALEWLSDCLPAESISILLLPLAEDGDVYKARNAEILLNEGPLPLAAEEFSAWIRRQKVTPRSGPLVINVVGDEVPEIAGMKQVIIAPLAEGENLFGWVVAVNHLRSEEFGTIEASLLQSVGAILGIHAGNRNLYRQQSEFLAGVVRAFTSAIDAKDPYTCGHSDRVARIAVRLAQQVNFEELPLSMLYMAGLLHDIGKIGINDAVLRKPGQLTEEEYEHIKQHPELGYRILADIRQLSSALPVVLHHHEQWDGGGYPHGLTQEEIPLEARIVAVADAYDAMTSDRPYRKGMPHAKVEAIFRSGAGRQWDPRIIEAFFASSDDIRDICRRERANLSLDVKQWTCPEGEPSA